MSNAADRFAEELAPHMKTLGFRKNRRTWHRLETDVIHVLNVQASQWDNETFYVNLGVYVRSLGNLSRPPESKCHIRRRAPIGDVSSVLEFALPWFSDRISIAQVQKVVASGAKGDVVTVAAKNLGRGAT